MKITFKIIALCLVSLFSYGQNTFIDAGVALGSDAFSVVAGYNKNWNLGKKSKFIVGTGVRFTSFSGKNKNFITAPAKLTANETSIDTLFAPTPKLYGLNLIINLGYKISPKIEAGFNVDAIGASFGPEGTPNYIRNGVSKATMASPTKVNLLLVGDNDKGSLNSQFYAKYKLNDKLGIKLAYQFLFNELTTKTKIQTVPEANDRFRLKSSMIFGGVFINL